MASQDLKLRTLQKKGTVKDKRTSDSAQFMSSALIMCPHTLDPVAEWTMCKRTDSLYKKGVKYQRSML